MLTGGIAFVQVNPPESAQTDISLSQFLAIQEKGVSAWEFEPELEIANCFVEARTEIEFFDGPHEIHGVGTFDFLHHHLKWPVVVPLSVAAPRKLACEDPR